MAIEDLKDSGSDTETKWPVSRVIKFLLEHQIEKEVAVVIGREVEALLDSREIPDQNEKLLTLVDSEPMLAYLLSRRLSLHDAEDIVQAVQQKTLQELQYANALKTVITSRLSAEALLAKALDDVGEPNPAWVWTVAKNLEKDHWRKTSRRKVVANVGSGEGEHDPETSTSMPMAGLIDCELRDAIRECLSHQSEAQQTVLGLLVRDLETNYAEMARIMGRSIQACRKLIFDGRKQLQTCLERKKGLIDHVAF